MPLSTPPLTVYFVYALKADGHPFYVAIGRAPRADLRVPWVQAQMRKERKRRKGARHTEVIRQLKKLGIRTQVKIYRADLSQAAAKALAVKAIRGLKRRGAVLANKLGKGTLKNSVPDIVADLVRRVVQERMLQRVRG
jgi:hypothetical protein